MSELPSTAATLTPIDDHTWTVSGDLELVFRRGHVFVLDDGYVLPSQRPSAVRSRSGTGIRSTSASSTGVDRSGEVHDHIHLLANVLPVLFGVADDEQSRQVLELVQAELDEFQDGRMLLDQLDKVAAQGAADNYVMGERYDMRHVYYVDDKPWHGAAHYYEYPCAFAWVLFHEYVGVQPAIGAANRRTRAECCLSSVGPLSATV